MLVLGRKENQSIIIGDNIRITIVGRSGSSIRIGVQAPSDVKVIRAELEFDTSSDQRQTISEQDVKRHVTDKVGEKTSARLSKKASRKPAARIAGLRAGDSSQVIAGTIVGSVESIGESTGNPDAEVGDHFRITQSKPTMCAGVA